MREVQFFNVHHTAPRKESPSIGWIMLFQSPELPPCFAVHLSLLLGQAARAVGELQHSSFVPPTLERTRPSGTFCFALQPSHRSRPKYQQLAANLATAGPPSGSWLPGLPGLVGANHCVSTERKSASGVWEPPLQKCGAESLQTMKSLILSS